MTKIKICGITCYKDILYVNEAMPDYIGFIFAESRRRVNVNLAFLLKTKLNKQIKAVGVFVNEDMELIKNLCDNRVIDIVQLHGDEDENYISALKRKINNPIIKAVRVKDKIGASYSGVDYTLFDTYNKAGYGGTGESFDWDIIKGFEKPFFLAGGLSFGNVSEAIRRTHPYCVDISSGVETEGVKDRQKILDIVRLVRNLETKRYCDRITEETRFIM